MKMNTLEAIKVLEDFKEISLIHRGKNDCELFLYLEAKLEKLLSTLPKGNIVFRARLYQVDEEKEEQDFYNKIVKLYINSANEEEFKEKLLNITKESVSAKIRRKRFEGYNEKDSFVNLNINTIPDGRCNYRFVPCLYVSNDVYTVISEMKPTIGANISVAKIKIIDDLKLIDLRIKQNEPLIELIGFLFTQSLTLEKPDVYIYTQVICDFIKEKGYDGVIYSSCQNVSGVNYAIFNYKKCKAISSEVYSVKSLHVKYDKRQSSNIIY